METNTITSKVELHSTNSREVPKDPYKFGTDIQYSQSRDLPHRHNVLFNKGRYFETSIYDKELREFVAKKSQTKIEFDVMIVDSWKKLEAFVAAMNEKGYYVKIDIDWI